jgi:trimethylamine--corrinoid protein Co-methyltransferase
MEVDTAFDAIEEVEPGGHFFATAHTMERYAQAFRDPIVADLTNHGTWTEAGSKTAPERATAEWKRRLAETPRPAHSEAAADRLAPFIEAGAKAGGAPPVD